MERRFEVRKRDILQEVEIQPEVSEGMLKRLEHFAEPSGVLLASALLHGWEHLASSSPSAPRPRFFFRFFHILRLLVWK